MTTRYTKDHEWVRLDGDVAIIGISAYAVDHLGDIVSVEMPAIGATFAAGAELAVVDAVKTAAEVYAPISGAIVEVNKLLNDHTDGGAVVKGTPELVNASPEGEGWFVKVRPANKAELDALMDEAAYSDYVKGLA